LTPLSTALMYGWMYFLCRHPSELMFCHPRLTVTDSRLLAFAITCAMGCCTAFIPQAARAPVQVH
jgi:hypothetical protein